MKEVYRVKKNWLEPGLDVFAYESLDYAIEICDLNEEFSVFDSSGTIVYPPSRVK